MRVPNYNAVAIPQHHRRPASHAQNVAAAATITITVAFADTAVVVSGTGTIGSCRRTACSRAKAPQRFAVHVHLSARQRLEGDAVATVVGRHKLVGDDAVLRQDVEATQCDVLWAVMRRAWRAHEAVTTLLRPELHCSTVHSCIHLSGLAANVRGTGVERVHKCF